MGFNFKGIFTNTTDSKVLAEAALRWPFCTVYRIQKPFEGLAIFREAEPINGDFMQSYEEQDQIKKELPELSAAFPQYNFIYLRADSFGGDCTYDGFACKAGDIILDNRGEGSDEIVRAIEIRNLCALVAVLGVTLNSFGHFEPFERGFFDNSENVLYPEPQQPTPTTILEKKKPWWQFWK